MIGLLVVEMIIGYEWFISGLVKFVRGGFPAGLAEELAEKSGGVAAWYGHFLEGAVIPNAALFGYVIETSELLAGVALIAGPLIWLFAWDRVSDRTRRAVLLITAAAAIGGAFLAVNLHLANGASHPWLIPDDAFDEGIDLDSVLPALHIVIATASIILFRRLRRETAGTKRRTMAMQIDPVCGMPLEGQDGAGMAEYKGTTYYFDKEECMIKFNERPEQYAVTSSKKELGDTRK